MVVAPWPEAWRSSLVRGGRPGRADVRADVEAGLVLTGLLVPAGMGYAEVAGLPPVTGLYATVAALIVYAAVGPSRVLILGPDSSLAPIIAAGIAPLAQAGSDRAVALAGVLALLTGLVLAVAGLLQLGLVTDLLSRPIRVGYLNGLAATLVVSQLPKLFGFEVDADDLAETAVGFAQGISEGDTNPTALLLGVASLAVIFGMRRMTPMIPGLLVAVAGATLVVWLGDLGDEVVVVGSLPRGLPAPALAGVTWGDVGSLLPVALGVALIASADTTVLSRSLERHGERVDESHEMAALGAANLACGAFGGFPVSASSSRTPVAVSSGARSQLVGLVGAGLVLVLALAAPGATAMLPASALAAVVIAAASTLADPQEMLALWDARRAEFGLALVTFAGVAFLGVLEGIGVAVVMSLAAFVARAWRPYRAELVRVERRKGYHDRDRHPDGRRIPGLVIARFDAPLFFANARVFSGFVEDLVAAAPAPTRWVMLAAEPITDVDTTAAEELAALDDRLAEAGIRLVFAEMKGPVKDQLVAYGLDGRFGPDRFYSTIGIAVKDYVQETGTEWTDWSDRSES